MAAHNPVDLTDAEWIALFDANECMLDGLLQSKPEPSEYEELERRLAVRRKVGEWALAARKGGVKPT